MDCMAAKALKSSLLSDIAGQQGGFVDDMWCVTGLMNNVPCDDFSVDDLLDFSDKDFKEDYDEDEEKASTLSLSTSHHHHRNSNFSSFSETDDDFGSLFSSELAAVPADELENLEWLSQFVDDSGSESSLLCPAGSFKDNKNKDSFSDKGSEPAVQVIRVPCFPFPLPVPVKPRSKRSRPNGKVWSGSTSLTSTESSSTSSSSSYGSSPFVLSNPVQDIEMLSSIEKPPAKKQKKKPATDTGLGTSRRCSHCQVQKTPQWRTGPLGSKTLCNACGVRFKSGRLFPEYRPACSPTFSQDVHSNSHRKVLEMRTKKDMSGHVEAGLSQMSPSF